MITPEIMRHLSSLYNFVQLKSELTPYYVEIVPAVSGGEVVGDDTKKGVKGVKIF